VTNYLLVVQFSKLTVPDKNTKAIGTALQRIKAGLESLRNSNHAVAFTSRTATTVGFFLQSELTAGAIKSVLQSPDSYRAASAVGTERQGSCFRNDDSFFLLELGDDSTSQGLTSAALWLRNHKTPR
jgi:hypothetical protein